MPTCCGVGHLHADNPSGVQLRGETWSVSINLLVSQFFRPGEQRMTLQSGARYWAQSPDAAAHGWGGHVNLTFLFPK